MEKRSFFYKIFSQLCGKMNAMIMLEDILMVTDKKNKKRIPVFVYYIIMIAVVLTITTV